MAGVERVGLDEVSESGKSKTTGGFEDGHVKKTAYWTESHVSAGCSVGRSVHWVRVHRRTHSCGDATTSVDAKQKCLYVYWKPALGFYEVKKYVVCPSIQKKKQFTVPMNIFLYEIRRFYSFK